MSKIFISYRRSDSLDISQRLASAIGQEFGESNIFFDKISAPAGTVWPKAIKLAIQQAEALIVVIGSKWLHTHDEKSGRRRIDIRTDWVRLEIATFLERCTSNDKLLIIPVLVNGASIPRAEYLNLALSRLSFYQPAQLSDTGNKLDISDISRRLIQFRINPVILPPVVTKRMGRVPPPLSKEEEDTFLKNYKHWSIVEQDKPGTSGDVLRQLYRLYEFDSYELAWSFMQRIDEVGIRPHNHHPRWQNNFNRLEVWLCTSNNGHKPSKKDTRLAEIFEREWREFK
jgi:pterin-4a-carbinolamine dehydratase